jgi:hypothetical protein
VREYPSTLDLVLECEMGANSEGDEVFFPRLVLARLPVGTSRKLGQLLLYRNLIHYFRLALLGRPNNSAGLLSSFFSFSFFTCFFFSFLFLYFVFFFPFSFHFYKFEHILIFCKFKICSNFSNLFRFFNFCSDFEFYSNFEFSHI